MWFFLEKPLKKSLERQGSYHPSEFSSGEHLLLLNPPKKQFSGQLPSLNGSLELHCKNSAQLRSLPLENCNLVGPVPKSSGIGNIKTVNE